MTEAQAEKLIGLVERLVAATEGARAVAPPSRGEVAAEWLRKKFEEAPCWRSDEIMSAAAEAGISRGALFSDEVMGVPFSKHKLQTPEGAFYWLWKWEGDDPEPASGS